MLTQIIRYCLWLYNCLPGGHENDQQYFALLHKLSNSATCVFVYVVKSLVLPDFQLYALQRVYLLCLTSACCDVPSVQWQRCVTKCSAYILADVPLRQRNPLIFPCLVYVHQSRCDTSWKHTYLNTHTLHPYLHTLSLYTLKCCICFITLRHKCRISDWLADEAFLQVHSH